MLEIVGAQPEGNQLSFRRETMGSSCADHGACPIQRQEDTDNRITKISPWVVGSGQQKLIRIMIFGS